MLFELEKNQFEYTAKKDIKLGKRPHLHPQIELILIESGNSIGFADSENAELFAGDLFIAFPNQIHYYDDKVRPVAHTRVIVSPDICPEFSHFFKSFVPKTPVLKKAGDRPLIVQNMNNIVECVEKDDEYSVTKLRGCLLILLSEIFSSIELKENVSCDTDIVKRIINCCYEKYTSDISLESIAKELLVNKYYVSHLFSKRLGISFSDYINSLRVMSACEILKTEDCTVSDVAFAVGYNSIRTFNRAFLAIKKMTPREYRNSFKNLKNT